MHLIIQYTDVYLTTVRLVNMQKLHENKKVN